MKEILDTILDPGSQPGDFAALPLPEAYRAVTLHRDEEHMFDGIHTRDRDPRKSLHVEEVPVPELGMERRTQAAAYAARVFDEPRGIGWPGKNASG